MSSLNGFLSSYSSFSKNGKNETTFEEFFEHALDNPHINQTAIQRVYNMILSHGTKNNEKTGKIEYNFFKNRIFGAEQQIEDIMDYLKASAMGLDIKKRVLLLLGPPGGGKSQISSMIKSGLARYSLTDAGAVFAIKQCPIHENPLHLLPESGREELWKNHKIKVEGKLCPSCQFKLETDSTWKSNIGNVPVERVFISEENRIGIGTFAPSEENDMSELYGSADLSKIDYYGNEGDARAYTFNGELHTANRGIMEFIEVLKANPAFLHVLLTLAEEQQFKTPRFPLQYVDELLIAHTNESEFLRFINQKENEAVVDRLYIVRMPYNMISENEDKIYHYALKTKLLVDNISVHPGSVRLASDFVIETRKNLEKLREGMSGISPRFILNTLAIALVKTKEKNLSPEFFFSVLFERIEKYPILNNQKRDEYLGFLKTIFKKMDFYNDFSFDELEFIFSDKKNLSAFEQFYEDDIYN